MTAKELAERLYGAQYPFQVPAALREQAKAAGLVVVYGASDDLMEFEGAIYDDRGANDGTTAFVDALGLQPSWEELDKEDKDALREYFKREGTGVAIEALWCAEPGFSWTYKTEIPHETFLIMEEGEPYCRGIVFALKDAVALAPAPY